MKAPQDFPLVPIRAAIVALSMIAGAAPLIAQDTAYSSRVKADGAIHYWRFEEADAADPAADEISGVAGQTNAPGTYTGGIQVAQPSAGSGLGNAIRLDGLDGTHVAIGSPQHPGNSISVEAWINLDVDNTVGFAPVFARWDGSYELDVNVGGPPADAGNFVVRNNSNAFGSGVSPVGLTRGTWHHVVGIFDGVSNGGLGAAQFYLDGVAGPAAVIGGDLQDAGGDDGSWYIGRTRNPASGFSWKGLIDEVAIYDKALTPEEIAQHLALKDGDDADGDGLPNDWESENGLDPNDPDDAALDADNDGLNNSDEFLNGTDPQDADSDSDGLTDGEEVNTSLTGPNDPDSDGDGLTDGAEVNGNPATDPTNPDTDGDGRDDNEEVNGDPATDPTDADSDDDGFPDGAEVAAGSDPNDPNDTPSVGQSTGYSQQVLSDGAIHYWRFEEVDPSQAAADEITGAAGQTNNPGTYEGGIQLLQPSAGAGLGSSMRLDGANGTHVALGDTPQHPGSSISVEAWVNLDVDSTTNFAPIIARWDGSYELDINATTGDLVNFVVRNDTNVFGNAPSLEPFPRGEWHHVVGIFEGASDGGTGAATVFVDGVSGGPVEIGGDLQDAGGDDGNWYIGRTRGPASGFAWKGLIDEVAIYPVALTESQIINHIALRDEVSFDFRITSVARDPATGDVTLIWNSRPGVFYSVRSSPDLVNWFELDDGVASKGDETTFTDTDVPQNPPRRFYRIRENAPENR